MTLTEFLEARLAEDEARARATVVVTGPGEGHTPDARLLREVEAKRAILELHKAWPVLVEAPPEFTNDDSTTFRLSKQIAWMTDEAYRVRFGTEPPTSQIVRVIASVYSDRPDFREEWRA